LLAGGHGDPLALHDGLAILDNFGPQIVKVLLASFQLRRGENPGSGGQRALGIVHKQLGLGRQANGDPGHVLGGRCRRSLSHYHRLRSGVLCDDDYWGGVSIPVAVTAKAAVAAVATGTIAAGAGTAIAAEARAAIAA
jgi:hypothetical protein